MLLMRSFFLFSRILGRAAFTGNHQWFLANNHIRDAHPPEVCGKKKSAYFSFYNGESVQ